ERHLEIAIAGVFELDGKLQAARALAAALEIGADTREQHAQGEKDLGFVGSSPFTEDRGFDCNGLRAWNEWTPVDSARELVPARRNRAEPAHEGTVRQAREITQPLDAEQSETIDNLGFDLEQRQRQRSQERAFRSGLADGSVAKVACRVRRNFV